MNVSGIRPYQQNNQQRQSFKGAGEVKVVKKELTALYKKYGTNLLDGEKEIVDGIVTESVPSIRQALIDLVVERKKGTFNIDTKGTTRFYNEYGEHVGTLSSQTFSKNNQAGVDYFDAQLNHKIGFNKNDINGFKKTEENFSDPAIS